MISFSPKILPETAPPLNVSMCQKCEVSNHSNSRLIWGEGNPLAPIFIILDNPGARENNLGEPFVCGTRETLQRAVSEAGLTIESIYISYILKCRPTKKYNKELSRLVCRDYLFEQVDRHKPKIVCCLGNVAVQSYLGNNMATVKDLRGNSHFINNLKTYVSYHPLAVRRRPVLYKYFLSDWITIGEELAKA